VRCPIEKKEKSQALEGLIENVENDELARRLAAAYVSYMAAVLPSSYSE
jgi:hypothetical protein